MTVQLRQPAQLRQSAPATQTDAHPSCFSAGERLGSAPEDHPLAGPERMLPARYVLAVVVAALIATAVLTAS